MTLGPMSKSWKQEMTARGLNFVDVSGMGYGPVDDQADRALRYLEESGVLHTNEELHFLGQSMGGMVARALAYRSALHGRVKTIITIGTPHHGADITHRTLN